MLLNNVLWAMQTFLFMPDKLPIPYYTTLFGLCHHDTTRKPDKTNGITNGNILSVIFTDGHNSVSKSVGIYRRPKSIGETVGIYRQTIFVGVYRPFRRRGIPFVWKYATAWWRQTIFLTEWPRDSNWDKRTVTWHFHWRNRQWNHRRIPSVSDSIRKTIIYPPIFLYFSFFFFPIPPLPSQTAATPIPTLHYSQHEHSISVRGHNIRFL